MDHSVDELPIGPFAGNRLTLAPAALPPKGRVPRGYVPYLLDVPPLEGLLVLSLAALEVIGDAPVHHLPVFDEVVLVGVARFRHLTPSF